MNTITFELRGEFIALNALLKATGLADSGGAAKSLVTEGEVRVNGEVESRRRRKIRADDRVVFGDTEIRVVSAAPLDDRATPLPES